MIRCRTRAGFALLVLGTLLGGAVPAARASTDSPFGPTRLAADFADHLDEIVAEGAADSAAGAAAAGDSAADAGAPDAGAPRPQFATGEARPASSQPSIAGPIAGALVGGTVGLYGGALLAYSLTDQNDDWESIGAALLGGFVGEVLLLPAGTHLGNGARGSFGNDLLVSFLSGLAAAAVIGATGSAAGAIIGTALQVGFVVAEERHVASKRAAERAASAP